MAGNNSDCFQYRDNYVICKQATFSEFLTETEHGDNDPICPYYSFVLLHSVWKHKLDKDETLNQLCKLKVLFDGEDNNLPKNFNKEQLSLFKDDSACFNKEINKQQTIIDVYPFLNKTIYDKLKNDTPGKKLSKEEYLTFTVIDNSKGIFPLVLYPNRANAMTNSIINIINCFDSAWEAIDSNDNWTKELQDRLHESGIKR